MITIKNARKKAEEYASGMKLEKALDDGEYFIFSYDEEVDEPPVCVNKETGEVDDYFPPDHMEAFLNAKEVEE